MLLSKNLHLYSIMLIFIKKINYFIDQWVCKKME